MPKLESQPFKSKLNKSSDQFEKNKSSMLSMLEEIDALLDEAELGGGEHHKDSSCRSKQRICRDAEANH